MIIDIKEHCYDYCLGFAYKCYDTNKEKYGERNQTEQKVIEWQIAVGKLCELATERMLDAKGIKRTDADFKIYDRQFKSYAPDLLIDIVKDGINKPYMIHVKSCVKSSTREPSWVFSSDDPLFLKHRDNDIIVFCEFISEVQVDVKAMANANAMIEFLKPPVLERLKDSKMCLYWQDIKEKVKLL